MLINKQLLEKYNIPVPRYTSYPPANYFREEFDYTQAVSLIEKSNDEEPKNISFYLHIPFCSQLCYYCGCNTHITKDRNSILSYVEILKKEIFLYKNVLSKDRHISQIHWGGGTPDYLDFKSIKEIMQIFRDNFNFIEDAEIAMECHPAHLNFDYLEELVDLGFNRLSIGIQDFDETVLKNVNRALPNMSAEEIVHFLHKKNVSVNLDFVYGLPGQTPESFRQTIEKAVTISPDRLALFSYAHVPWVKPHQKLLEQFHLPNAEYKTAMFEAAYTLLTESGYVSIGLDHFAKPNDELNIALNNKSLSRNFQGYCTRQTTGQVYALGVSGIGQLSSGYLQNTKDINSYSKSVEKGMFPFEKAYFLNEKEKLIGAIITEIMANRFISFDEFEKKFKISYEEILRKTGLDFNKLKKFEKEGLVMISEKEISITHQGMFFLRNIASSFDPLIKNSEKQFSKSL